MLMKKKTTYLVDSHGNISIVSGRKPTSLEKRGKTAFSSWKKATEKAEKNAGKKKR